MRFNKKGGREATNLMMIGLILGVILIIVVLFSISPMPKWITDIFPDLSGNNTINVEPDQNKDVPYFRFQDGRMDRGDIYFAYVEGIGWRWGDGSFWMSVNDIYTTGPNKAKFEKRAINDRKLIINLQDETCKIGLSAIIGRVLRNKEGGWFANTSLLIHYKGKVKEFEYEKGQQVDDLCKMIEGESENE